MYKYQISPYLLKMIKEITLLISELNKHKFSNLALMELQKNALELSSYSSTSIEGNPIPLTEVKRILKNRPTQMRDTEREVLQYNDTLMSLNQLIEKNSFKLSQKSVIKTHSQLMSNLLPKIKLGRFRKEPVVVNDPKIRKPIFYPPDHKDVEGLMDELIHFVVSERNNLDPLILAGIFHKQFVLIHPFIDGNGRTVRLMTKTILASHGIDTFFLFSFENYYNQNISKYFQKIGERGDFYDLKNKVNFTSWLEYFCEGILDELLRVQKMIQNQKNKNANLNPENQMSEHLQIILDYLEKNSFIRDADYAKLTKRAKATRSLDFKKLVKLNLIEMHGKGPATYYKLKSVSAN